MNNDLVSVLMPVYNADHFLKETIDSVLRQDYCNFELIAINDGSSDKSKEIIKEYQKKDKRIKQFNQKNMGLVKTLNRGINLAKGKYIARIDADDPWVDDKKLSKQMNAMTQDNSIVLIGGGFEICNEYGFFQETVATLTRDKDIRRAFYLRNPFGHSGVLFKKEPVLAIGLYSEHCGPTEDFDLWCKLANRGTLANLPQIVYRYRVNSAGISQTQSKEQMKYTNKLIDHLWKKEAPKIMPRKELVHQSKKYLETGISYNYGEAMKYQFLSDNAQLGVKMIKNKKISTGIWQMLLVASTGRSGIKIVLKRIREVLRGFKK